MSDTMEVATLRLLLTHLESLLRRIREQHQEDIAWGAHGIPELRAVDGVLDRARTALALTAP